jgi:hypothetical protein
MSAPAPQPAAKMHDPHTRLRDALRALALAPPISAERRRLAELLGTSPEPDCAEQVNAPEYAERTRAGRLADYLSPPAIITRPARRDPRDPLADDAHRWRLTVEDHGRLDPPTRHGSRLLSADERYRVGMLVKLTYLRKNVNHDVPGEPTYHELGSVERWFPFPPEHAADPWSPEAVRWRAARIEAKIAEVLASESSRLRCEVEFAPYPD